MSMRMVTAGVIAALYLVGSAGTAAAWSWTGDPDGERLDKEARHILTTQNVCGVVIKDTYLRDLHRRIARHSGQDSEYMLYLKRSVLSSNSEFLANATPEEIDKACKPRIDEARQKKLLVE